MGRWGDGEMGRFLLSDAARSWGASAVLGVPPMSNWRGFPHSRFASRQGNYPDMI
ncbi:hypothetical protein [Moorena sp. SIO4G3]|uniref:hypothetical protein n=1 Tax=Moorena sp. SIO4G3 TaxID=2607821 RepID=UPI0014292CA9|nr:hypothetical protein [Moorena sp. SIO4G3]NEO79746.1 hypothetical protein [Moorena sp. SIO4G3]